MLVFDVWFSAWAGARVGDRNMASIDCAGGSYPDFATRRPHLRKVVRLFALVLGAASLAACAQSSVVSQKSEFHASRQASLQRDRSTSSVMKRRVASVKR